MGEDYACAGAGRVMTGKERYQRQWRDYQTAQGNRPVRDYIAGIARENAADAARIAAAMHEVAELGTVAARHLRGEIWEVRAHGGERIFRILFATEGRYSQVLLALEGFTKKSRRTPPATIDLAESLACARSAA